MPHTTCCSVVVFDYYVRDPRRPEPVICPADEATLDAHRVWREHSHAYLRRDRRGAEMLSDAMLALGMAFEARDLAPLPEWPDPARFGVWFDDAGEPVGDRAAQYRAVREAVRDWHGPGIAGIPVHKVCWSSDGWHVTHAEAAAAVAAYETAMREGTAHPAEFGDDVIPFLTEAARCDGFVTR